MKRPWVVVPLFIVILILLALPRVVLLPRLTAELKGELAAALETAELDLTVEAPWGWELLMGRIPSLALTARDAGLEGVDVSQLNLEAEEILFQPWTLFTQHELVLTSLSSITGSLLVSESALNEAFWREVDPSRRLWLEISPQGLAVLGTVGIWNMDVSVRVLGDVVVENGSALRFVLMDLAVQDARVPELLLDMLRDSFDFTVDFGEFPLPVEMQVVELLEHKMEIRIGGRQ